MFKKVLVLVLGALLLVGGLAGGYVAGIRRATTSDGWIEKGPGGELRFVLEVDDNCYEWYDYGEP